jgi:hypothetical protein
VRQWQRERRTHDEEDVEVAHQKKQGLQTLMDPALYEQLGCWNQPNRVHSESV